MENPIGEHKLSYVAPPDAQDRYREGFMHKLVIPDENGSEIGYADYIYKGNPFPFYYLGYMKVSPDHQGKGYGRELLTTLIIYFSKRKRQEFSEISLEKINKLLAYMNDMAGLLLREPMAIGIASIPQTTLLTNK